MRTGPSVILASLQLLELTLVTFFYDQDKIKPGRLTKTRIP